MLNERLKRIRNDRGMTMREVATHLGIPFNTYAGYEYHPNRKIPASTLISISILFGETIDYLKYGVHSSQAQGIPSVIYVDSKSNLERIPYVPIAAQAGYLKNYSDENYLKNLDTFSLPGFVNGTYRMFSVEGDSMEPTYHQDDILICQQVEHFKYMQDGNCYVIISSEGVCVKRCINAVDKRKALIIESDNVEYKPDIISIESVIEIWAPRARITKF